MMKVTEFPDKRVEDYSSIVGKEIIELLKEKAEKIRGSRVLNVNSTAYGGGVAEILHNLVPLMWSLGIYVEWNVMEGSEEFFRITKSFHNALQGNTELKLTDDMKELYLETNKINAEAVDFSSFDYVIIHDPQPAAMIGFVKKTSPWVWRCHVDLSSPNMEFWSFLKKYVEQYDRYIFHMEEYIQKDLAREKAIIMPPSIDPLSEKNMEFPEEEVERILERFDVDPDRPILTQVSRFDPWKGIFDVIDVYRLVKRQIPDVQLLLVGVMAADDPEGWIYFERTLRRIGEDPDVKVLTNLIGVHAREVNAFQRASDVVLQMSTREGFGLTVSEAMWKEKPVIGRAVGGIRLQVIDGVTGFLVKDVEEAAEKAIYLLQHPEASKEMGVKARDRVKENFLITKHVERYLDLLSSL
ncbi:glycosyltransferase [Thermococcus sp.]